MRQRWIFATALVFANCLLATGCGTTGTASNLDGFWCDLTGAPTTYVQASLPANLAPAFPRDCFAGDMQVSSAQSCLVDDSVCYQLDTGDWCTAGRAPQCPAGSAPIAIEAPCPEGGKCWMYSDALRCHSV